MVSINKVKQLREKTGGRIIDCKEALEEAQGDIEKAQVILKKKGKEVVAQKKKRETGQGIIESYIHQDLKTGVLVELHCETDFVARSEEFKKLAHELCLQIASMDPSSPRKLLLQPWIKDESKTIKDLLDSHIAKLGENIEVKRFSRYQI